MFLRIALAFIFLAGSVFAAEQDPVHAAVIGRFGRGPVGAPVRVNATQFNLVYGSENPLEWVAEMQARRFFLQGGTTLHVIRAEPDGDLLDALEGRAGDMTGRHALPLIRDLGVLFCPELTLVPPQRLSTALPGWRDAMKARRAMLILDPPPGLSTTSSVIQWVGDRIPPDSHCFALYYPYLNVSMVGGSVTVGASGTMAAVWLQSDARPGGGIWESPGGVAMPLVAATPSRTLQMLERDNLNTAGICPIITSSSTVISFGVRHLSQSDPENRYIPVQRTFDWIRTNIDRMGIPASAVRANDPTLWAELRAQAEDFLHEIHLAGGLVGPTAAQSYFVQCGLGQTMTQADVNAHRVVLLVGVAMLRPGEFSLLSFSWDTRNPSRPLPPPRLVLKQGYPGMQLFHHTPPGAYYTITSSPNLAPGSWVEHAAPVTGDGTWRRSEFQAIFGRRFFRSEQTPFP